MTDTSIEKGTVFIHPEDGPCEVIEVRNLEDKRLFQNSFKFSMVKYRTITGQEKIVPLERVLKKVTKKSAYRRSFTEQEHTERYAFLLGYLCRHATIYADVPSNRIPNFRSEYTALKGQEPEKDEEGYRPYAGSGETWEYALRIALTLSESISRDDFLFTKSIEAPKNTEGDSLLISDNEWIWNLLRLGFRLGSTHSVDKIRASLPAAVKNFFEEGLNS